MDLTELKPKRAKFKLATTGKNYYLRPFNLEDEIWLANEYGEKIAEIFANLNMKEISRIVYHQLEDKRCFKEQDVIVMQEDGTEKAETFGGVELLRRCIQGMAEKQDIMLALNETIGLSRTDIEEAVGIKKKKKTLLQRIGLK